MVGRGVNIRGHVWGIGGDGGQEGGRRGEDFDQRNRGEMW